MIEILALNVYQAIAWTTLTFIVSMIYKHIGYSNGLQQGVEDTLNIFNHLERAATQRVFKKLKQDREKNAEAN